MSQVIVTANSSWKASGAATASGDPQGFWNGVPACGWQDFLPSLNGNQPITWLVRFCVPWSTGESGETHLGTGSMGFPLVNQCRHLDNPKNAPYSGWYLSVTPSRLYFTMCDGWGGSANDEHVKRNTYYWFGYTGYLQNLFSNAARWCSIAISVDAAGTVAAYIDGVSRAASATIGSLTSRPDLSAGTQIPRLRWFHSRANNEMAVDSAFAGAAGIWIYNKVLATADMAKLTLPPDNASWQPPDDPTFASANTLVARSYLGVGDWQTLRSGGGGGSGNINFD